MHEEHEHTYTHSHPHEESHDHHTHTHGDDHEHTHTYHHHHDHDEPGHTHDHPECHDHADCHACGGCDPMEELKAMMKYMVNHNTAHANELAELAKQLEKAGNHVAYEQVMLAVSDFEKGNLRLSTTLAALEG